MMSELLNKLGYLVMDSERLHQQAKALFDEVQRQEDQRAEQLRRGTEVLDQVMAQVAVQGFACAEVEIKPPEPEQLVPNPPKVGQISKPPFQVGDRVQVKVGVHDHTLTQRAYAWTRDMDWVLGRTGEVIEVRRRDLHAWRVSVRFSQPGNRLDAVWHYDPASLELVCAAATKHPLADAQPWDPVWVRAYSWGPWFLRLFSRLVETPEGLRIETFEHSTRGEHCLVWVEGKPWVKGAKP